MPPPGVRNGTERTMALSPGFISVNRTPSPSMDVPVAYFLSKKSGQAVKMVMGLIGPTDYSMFETRNGFTEQDCMPASPQAVKGW